jgi:hypothetical protein
LQHVGDIGIELAILLPQCRNGDNHSRLDLMKVEEHLMNLGTDPSSGSSPGSA